MRPLLLLAAVGLALTGCGDDGSDGAVPTTTSTTSTTSARAEMSTSSTVATTRPPTTPVARCRAGQLLGLPGTSDVGAGQVRITLLVRNVSPDACSVQGYPGVSVLDDAGQQVGEAASREPAQDPPLVRLEPGSQAMTVVHTNDGGTGGACRPGTTQVRLVPPDDVESLTFPATLEVCETFAVTPLAPAPSA